MGPSFSALPSFHFFFFFFASETILLKGPITDERLKSIEGRQRGLRTRGIKTKTKVLGLRGLEKKGREEEEEEKEIKMVHTF